MPRINENQVRWDVFLAVVSKITILVSAKAEVWNNPGKVITGLERISSAGNLVRVVFNHSL